MARQMAGEEARPDVIVLARRRAEHESDLLALEEFVGRLGLSGNHCRRQQRSRDPSSAHSRASGNPDLPAFRLGPWVPAFAGTSGERSL